MHSFPWHVTQAGNSLWAFEILRKIAFTRTRSTIIGAIAEYPVEIEEGGKGLASTRQISSVAGSLSEAISYEMAMRSWII